MENNNLSHERRQYKRISLDKSVNYKTIDEDRMNNAISRDISKGGLKLLSFKFVPKDKKVILELQLQEEIIRTLGQVVWNKELPFSGRYEIGIKFDYVDYKEHINDAEKVISDYVNNKITSLN